MTTKKLRIATLRAAPPASVDVPENFPRARGEKADAKKRPIERSVVGALRLFPGVPKAVTEDEVAYIKAHRLDVATRIDVRPYVESKRKDHRGVTEVELKELATKEGVDHLPLKKQVKVLTERGKLEKPKPVKGVKPKAMKRPVKAPDLPSGSSGSGGKGGKK